MRPTRIRGHDHRFHALVRRRCFDRPTSLRIDAGRPGHLRIRRPGEEFSGRSIQHVEEGILRRLHDHATLASVDLEVG